MSSPRNINNISWENADEDGIIGREEMVKLLESWVNAARKGEFISVMLCAVSPEGNGRHAIAGMAHPAIFAGLGHCATQALNKAMSDLEAEMTPKGTA